MAPWALASTSLFWPLINAGQYQSLVTSPPWNFGVCRNTFNANQDLVPHPRFSPERGFEVSWHLGLCDCRLNSETCYTGEVMRPGGLRAYGSCHVTAGAR